MSKNRKSCPCSHRTNQHETFLGDVSVQVFRVSMEFSPFYVSKFSCSSGSCFLVSVSSPVFPLRVHHVLCVCSSVMSISPSVSCLPFRSPVSPPCFLFLVSLVSHVHPCVLHSPSWLCVPHSFVLCISSVCLVPMSDIFSSCVQCVQFLFPCLLFIPAVFPMCFLSP